MDGVTHIRENTGSAELLKEINKDEFDEKTKMSSIDLMSRLESNEISGLTALDSLVSMSFLPVDVLSISRQKKRLSVSLNGEGRKEIIRIFENKEINENQNTNKNFLGKIFGR